MATNQQKKPRRRKKKPKPKTKDQLREEDLKDTFSMFDKDGDGAITQKELLEVFSYLNLFPTEIEMQDLFDEFDKNKSIKSGSIYFEDFVDFMNTSNDGVSLEKEIEMAFKCIDTSNSGFIQAKDLKKFLFATGDTVTNDEVNSVIKDSDMDNTGKLNLQEFSRLVFDNM